MRQEAEPQAVFVFYEDGSGVDAFASLPDLAAELEAIDVRNGEYTFFTADGRVIRGVVNGGAARDFELHVTQEDAADLLRQRLETVFDAVKTADARCDQTTGWRAATDGVIRVFGMK